MAPSSKRVRKTPGKLKDNAFLEDIEKCEKWCSVVSIEDNKTHVLNAKSLETESCEFVTEDDVQPGTNLIWKYKGKPYTVTVQEVYNEKPKGRKQKREYQEDSESAESTADTEPSKKKKRNKRKKHVVTESEGSESSSEESTTDTDTKKHSSTPQKSEVTGDDSSTGRSDESGEDEQTLKTSASHTTLGQLADGFLHNAKAKKKTEKSLVNRPDDVIVVDKCLNGDVRSNKSKLSIGSAGSKTPSRSSSEDSRASSRRPVTLECSCESAGSKVPSRSSSEDGRTPSKMPASIEQKVMVKLNRMEKHLDARLRAIEKKRTDILMKSSKIKVEDQTESMNDDIEVKVKDEPDMQKFILENGINLLSVRALNPEKYALALLDCLFEDTELASHCFCEGKRSTKPALSRSKTQLIEDCID